MNSKGGGKTVQTQQTSEPWPAQQPYLRDVFAKGNSLHGQGPMQYYPGQTVAAQSPYTQQGLQQLAGSSTDPNSLTNLGRTEFGNTIRGDYLNADTNPYLKGAVDTALGDVQGRVSGTFGRGGGNNYGSSAHQEWLGKNLADTALPIYAQNYQTERGRQMQAAQMAPGMDTAASAGLLQAGGMQDTYQQALINADKAKHDFGQMAPWDALQRYQGSITGQYGGTQTGTQPYYPADPFANALGLGIGGLGLYGMGKDFGLWGS